MKVLALGALWVPYIRDNWFDALRHTLGNAVTCINAGPLIASREKSSGQSEGFHAAYIYDLLRKEHFDYLFFYHDWIFGDFPDQFFAKVRRAGVRTVAFHPDDEPEHWFARNSAYDHHFDVIASHSSAGTMRRQTAGWEERALYLPWGYNPRTCHLLAGQAMEYDVVFTGKHKIDPARGVAHIEDGSQREAVLVRLAEACQQRGWTFRVFGHGWDQHPILHNWHGGLPSQEQLVHIYNTSRIVFNPAWSSDGNPNGVQTKLRHFEVPGCGAFQLTNENPELAKLFMADEEIVFYRNDDELIDKVTYYLDHESARRAIAAKGHARALREHTLDTRVEKLFSAIQQVYPAASLPFAPVTPVCRVDFSSINELAALEKTMPNDTWLHFAGGNFAELKTDYQSIQPFLRALPNRILAIQTHVHYTGLADNPLQPKLMETDNALLSSHVDIHDFTFGPHGPCPDTFAGIQDHERARLTINYLVPPGQAGRFITAFITGTIDTVDNLDAFPTGRIVSEVALPPPPEEVRNRPIRNHEYVRRLRRILPAAALMQQKSVLYGISGMGEIVLRLVEEIEEFQLSGVIDRSLQGQEFKGLPILRPQDIVRQGIDLVILASGASGPAIYSDIEEIEADTCILPLYDLNHPAWRLYV